jgi:hypothetical protein
MPDREHHRAHVRTRKGVRFVTALAIGTMLIVLGMSVPALSASPGPVFSVQTLPTSPNQAYAALSGVSCPTAGSCVGVGVTQGNSFTAFAETLSGGTWTPSLVGAGIVYPALSAIWCASVTSCIAVGEYNTGSTGEPLIETLANGTWTATTTGLVPAGYSGVNLNSISCTTITSCVAGGLTGLGDEDHALIDTLAGSTWTASVAADPTDSTYTDISSVQCFSTTSCLAVGLWAQGGAPYYPLLETLSGATWTASTIGATGDSLTSLSCSSAISCLAVGNSTVTGGLGISEALSGTTWTRSTIPIPAGASSINGMNGVSCSPDPSTCVAVGSYRAPPQPAAGHALVEYYASGTWTATTGIDPSAGSVDPAAVACPDIGSCVGVGSMAVQGPNELPIAITSTPAAATPPPIGPSPTPLGNGYWLSASDGGIFNYGDAGFFGSAGDIHLNKPIVGMAPTPDGGGYWLVASDGGIFTEGDAVFHGSTGNIHLNQPIVGMAVTHDGGGYWLVASDGGVFAEGDAVFYGSTGNIHLNKPIVGMAPSADGKGYWLVASDGGIFTEGDAVYYGSTGNLTLNKPIVGMAPTADGKGYWLAASDGGIFTEGDAVFHGSAGSIHLNQPIVGVAAS